MKSYSYTKTINNRYFWKELRQVPEIKAHLLNLNSKGDQVWVNMHDDFDEGAHKAKIDAAMSAHDYANYNAHLQVEAILHDARRFAQIMEDDFLNENIRLGITQLGLTNHVRKSLTEVSAALHSASLYDVVLEISRVPSEDLDAQIMTAARLLKFRNEVEEYLGITPLAATYDQAMG